MSQAVEKTLERTREHLERGIDAGLQIGAQLFVSQQGRTVADWALGEAATGVAMRNDTIMLWLSAGKPLLAVAVGQLLEAGELALDDAVVRFVPEFGLHGKHTLTLRHLLTHTAGLRNIAGAFGSKPVEEILEAIYDAEPEWTEGEEAGYSAATNWYVLGEVIRRVDGRAYPRYVRQMVLEPLGMTDSWVGMPEEMHVGYGERIGGMANYLLGARNGAVRPARAAECAMDRPGGNARGPVRELGRFYEAMRSLLQNGGAQNGRQVLKPETVELLTRRTRVGMHDQTFGQKMDWGLGFMVNANYDGKPMMYGYGPYAGPETFGHGGHGCSVGFCDPQHGLVVAAVMNGQQPEPRHQPRMRKLCAAIYRDLGLAGDSAEGDHNGDDD